MLGLQYFGARELWNPWLLLLAVLIGVAYMMATGSRRHRFADSEPVSWKRRLSFMGGLFLLYFSIGGPLNLLGHLMFSAHMLGMSLAYLLAPPLLLIGLPAWLLRPFVNHRHVRKPFQFLTHPLIAVLGFNVLFSFYHLPVSHDFIMTNVLVHWAFYVALLLAALMMWWPIIAPIPDEQRLSSLRKMAYVFANGVLLTPACALIIFAGVPVYAIYSDPDVWVQAMGFCIPGDTSYLLEQFNGPQYFAIFPLLEDQQLGGVIMKVMQELVYGAALGYIFFNWYMTEKKDDEPLEPKPIM